MDPRTCRQRTDARAATSALEDEEDATTAIVIQATDEMEPYRCEIHDEEMSGRIEIRST